MGENRPKRRWYRKKRWWAAALLWLALSYPACRGPVAYAAARGWFSRSAADAFYVPLDRRFPAAVRRFDADQYVILDDSWITGAFDIRPPEPAGAAGYYWRYVGWWESLAWGPPP